MFGGLWMEGVRRGVVPPRYTITIRSQESYSLSHEDMVLEMELEEQRILLLLNFFFLGRILTHFSLGAVGGTLTGGPKCRMGALNTDHLRFMIKVLPNRGSFTSKPKPPPM